MPKSLPKWAQSLTITQWAFAIMLLLVVIFLLFGTATQSSTVTPIGFQPQPFFILALLAFGGGLLSFVSPCTLPILPAYFAFAFQSGRKQIAANTIAFMLGLATMFSFLGATASALGRLLRHSQEVILLVGGSAIIIFGVMSLLGKGFGGMKNEESTHSGTLGGSYFFGLTFAVGWSSCVGPILGTMLTMAATTGSIFQGVMLLFIYAIGLGLPLVIVSTLFGRASRQSLFWRILRGKGWEVTTSVWLVSILWVYAVWRILVGVIKYAFFNDFASIQRFGYGHELGLLAVAILGVALWVLTMPKSARQITLQLHSTQLISGVLFITMGVLMLSGRLASFNSLVPPDLALWFAGIEEAFMKLLN